MKKYGIPKSVICGRLPDFFMQTSRRRSLAVGIRLRNFVAKNSRTRTACDSRGQSEKKAPALTSQGSQVLDG